MISLLFLPSCVYFIIIWLAFSKRFMVNKAFMVNKGYRVYRFFDISSCALMHEISGLVCPLHPRDYILLFCAKRSERENGATRAELHISFLLLRERGGIFSIPRLRGKVRHAWASPSRLGLFYFFTSVRRDLKRVSFGLSLCDAPSGWVDLLDGDDGRRSDSR